MAKAKKEESQSKALVTWRDRAKQSAQREKAVSNKLPNGSGNFIALKGGQITINGNEAENPLPVIVLASQNQRAFYSKPYTGEASTPDCYSFDGDAPHPNVAEPESDKCKTCPLNVFGSAPNKKGKACKESVKLAVIHSDAVKKGTIADTPIFQVNISTTNAKTWKNYVEAFADDEAPWMYVTDIRNKPHPKNQYEVSFKRTGLPQNDELMGSISDRLAEAEKLLVQPFPEAREEAPTPAPSGRKRKFA